MPRSQNGSLRVAIALGLLAGGCGRVGFDAIDASADGPGMDGAVDALLDTTVTDTVIVDTADLPPIASIDARGVMGANLTPGLLNAVILTIDPPEASVPGRPVEVTVDRFFFGAGMPVDVTVRLVVDSDGVLPSVGLYASIGTPPGEAATLTSDVPLTGDLVYTVISPPTTDMTFDGDTIAVADGLTASTPVALSAAERATFTGSARELAFPRPGSAYPPGPYIGMGGTPDIYRARDMGGGGVELFASSDGVSGPDANISYIAFGDPAGPWADRMYVCSASLGGGDGIFTVGSTGTFAVWSGFNNCNAIVIDHARTLGDPGYVPMYVNVSGDTTQRFAPDMGTEVLGTGLNSNTCGYNLEIAPSGDFAGRLWFFSCEDSATVGDGVILFDDDVDNIDPTAFLDPAADPVDAVFTVGSPLGDLMYVVMNSTGEIRGFRPDGSSFLAIGGLDDPGGLTLGPTGRSFWFINRGTGQIFRVTAASVGETG